MIESVNDMVGRPKGTGGIAKELTKNEVERVNRWLAGTRHELRNRAIFYLGLGTGMRLAEIVGLKIKDVAPHGKLISEIVLEKHRVKGKKSVTVIISKQAKTHLKVWLDSRKTLPELDDPVFPSQKHPRKPMNANWAVHMMSTLFHDAGVANASSHSMRRTHINKSLRTEGVIVTDVQEQVGHAHASTTYRYAVTSTKKRKEIVEDLKF